MSFKSFSSLKIFWINWSNIGFAHIKDRTSNIDAQTFE